MLTYALPLASCEVLQKSQDLSELAVLLLLEERPKLGVYIPHDRAVV